MDIKKYLTDPRDPVIIAQAMATGSGEVILRAIKKRYDEKVESLLNLPIDKIVEKEVAYRLGEIRGLKMLGELYDGSRNITENRPKE